MASGCLFGPEALQTRGRLPFPPDDFGESSRLLCYKGNGERDDAHLKRHPRKRTYDNDAQNGIDCSNNLLTLVERSVIPVPGGTRYTDIRVSRGCVTDGC